MRRPNLASYEMLQALRHQLPTTGPHRSNRGHRPGRQREGLPLRADPRGIEFAIRRMYGAITPRTRPLAARPAKSLKARRKSRS